MDFNANIDSRFETEIGRYNTWRENLARSVQHYHAWLESTNQLNVQQSIRFYDLLEALNRGRLTLAFLAEFSRGKSELINALFFSSFEDRLLPSDVGRTTMQGAGARGVLRSRAERAEPLAGPVRERRAEGFRRHSSGFRPSRLGSIPAGGGQSLSAQNTCAGRGTAGHRDRLKTGSEP